MHTAWACRDQTRHETPLACSSELCIVSILVYNSDEQEERRPTKSSPRAVVWHRRSPLSQHSGNERRARKFILNYSGSCGPRDAGGNSICDLDSGTLGGEQHRRGIARAALGEIPGSIHRPSPLHFEHLSFALQRKLARVFGMHELFYKPRSYGGYEAMRSYIRAEHTAIS